MTWSIVAHDAKTGAFAVAVTTRFFAVGALCPHVQSHVGAVATQALINPLYGPRALALLSDEVDPTEAIRQLVAPDDGREARQLHMIDRRGRIGQHTGKNCIGWCGHLKGEGYAVAGNMLTGAAVIEETAKAYESGKALPFAERLMVALGAGQVAGGDKRGKQSAALRIHTSETYPALDLRVDDHPDPLIELRRLYEVSKQIFQPFMKFLPSAANPAGIYDRAVIDAELARIAAVKG
ncbi:MAG TPA: DUF1028 domain-containing protein [Alphaproteobacteria bacterium]|nr:DUF1028 domain-containing protein [Alphaproteobacteria bacterium]